MVVKFWAARDDGTTVPQRVRIRHSRPQYDRLLERNRWLSDNNRTEMEFLRRTVLKCPLNIYYFHHVLEEVAYQHRNILRHRLLPTAADLVTKLQVFSAKAGKSRSRGDGPGRYTY